MSCVTGDNQFIFTERIKPLYDSLYFYLLKILKTKEDTEDVFQDTLIAGYKNYDKLMDDSKFDIWMFKIGKNLAFRLIKTKSRFDLIDDFSTVPNLNMISFEDSPEKALLNKDLRQRVRKYINALPLQQRKILFYHYYCEMKLTEISKHFAINYNTVVSTHKRALKTMSSFMNENELKDYLTFEFDSEGC